MILNVDIFTEEPKNKLLSRQWRIEYEGALYHVLSIGNEQREIFNGNEDRKMFLEALGQMSNRFDVEIWELGIYSGREIGEVLGLGYSSVSRRAHIMRKRIQKDKVFKKEFKDIKSKIKL